MFGLMKARTCTISDDEKESRRLHYCGTCKTLGSLYGQRTRFLLNHDAVFLAEVLSALDEGREKPVEWDPSFVSRNCLSLPAKDAPIPAFLPFAAAATVVLAEAKLADRVADSGQLRWRLGQRLYSGSFDEASRWLRDRGFPLDEVRSALASQEKREEDVLTGRHEGSIASSLAYLAEPTSRATGLFFAHGATLAGRPEAVETLSSLGKKLGTLVYHLDALEDYARDARSGEFNAYRAVLGGAEAALSAADSVTIGQQIWSMGVEVCDLIAELPIPAGRKDLFAARLRTNLSVRLGLSPKQAACSCVSSLQDVKQPAGDARRAAPAASWRESPALLLNLPFLVSMASAFFSPLRFSATGSGGIPEAAGEAVKHAKKHAGGGSEGGGCCDSCDCGDCDCGGCDC
jgi:DNA-binding transcriptional MerR regulator